MSFKMIASFIILLLAVLLISCPQDPQEKKEYQGFNYEYYMWGLEITGYTGTRTDILFPSHIKNLPVISILGNEILPNSGGGRTKAPFENKNLTSVTFPDTIRYINVGAFANNNLKEIQLPSNLTVLGALSFMNNQIASIVIPDSVWYNIGGYAFEGNKITELSIGSRVERIEYAAFRNNKIGSLTIPSNINFIGEYAFASNEITELNFTEGLDTVASNAFEGNLLTSLSIPADVTIGYYVFINNNITNLNIGNNVRIGSGSFSGNFITYIEIGENVQLYKDGNLPVFELGFDDFFLDNESKAGTYFYENNKWEFSP